MFLLLLLKHFGCYCNLKVSIDLQWEKWKLRFIAISLQIFWQKFYRNVPGIVLYKPYEFVQIVDFDWLPWQPKCLIFKNNIQKSSQMS